MASDLPESISERVLSFPEVHGGVHRVTVVLADGRTFTGVEVAWGEEVIRVADHDFIPFNAGEVVEVFDESAL